MWAIVAVSPSAIKTGALLFLGVLLAVLAIVLAAWLWLVLNREGRRTRQESLVSIAALLRAPDKATRLYALNLLISFPVTELSVIEELLRELLCDREAEVRAAANRLLSMLYPPGRLLKQLASKPAEGKLQAIEGLAAVGSQKALAALLETAARASEEKLRQAARAAMARSDTTEKFPFLINMLGSADPILRATIKEILRLCGLEALVPLLTALRAPGKTTRTMAAKLLGDLQLEGGAEALVAALSDPVDEVRIQAAKSLGKLGIAKSAILFALEKRLGDSTHAVRDEAAAALAVMGQPSALIPLLGYLRHRVKATTPPPREVMRYVASNSPVDPMAAPAWKALLEADDESVFGALAEAMEEAAEQVGREWLQRLPTAPNEVRETLHILLVRLGKCGLRAPLCAVIHDHSPAAAPVRAEIARILGEIATPELAEEVYVLLSDTDIDVRREAACAAGGIAHFATIDGLCRALNDPEAEVRREAAHSLALLTDQAFSLEQMPEDAARRLLEEAGAGLLQAVNDPVEAVREEVAKALGSARTTAAIPALVTWALDESLPEVSKASVEALCRMPASDTVPLVAEALSYESEEIRRRAAELLGRIGDAGAVSHLIRSFNDSSPHVRAAAARALWESAAAEKVGALLPHAQSPDPKIRAAIVGVLGKLRAEEALDNLAHALHDPNEFVRAAVMNALGRFGPGAMRHLKMLAGQLEDHDAFVRARTVRAVYAVGGKAPEVSTALKRAIKDEDPMVASEALECMVELVGEGELGPLAEAVTEPQLRAAASDLLSRAEPDRLKGFLQAVRGAKGEAQIRLLGLLAETLKAFGTVEEYKEDLQSVDIGVRSAALEALSLLETEEATAAVVETLKSDPAAGIRKRAVTILAGMGGDAAQAALRKAAEHDPDPEVRESARLHIRLSSS